MQGLFMLDHYLITQHAFGHRTVTMLQIESKVYKMFTKRLKGCKDMDYTARLSFLHLYSLERRRLTADLILTYILLLFRFSIDISMTDYFHLQSTNGDHAVSRGNPCKLSVNHCRINTRENVL